MMQPAELAQAKKGDRATPDGVVSLPVGADESTWLEERRTGVGGTDAAAITGHNRYRSALAVHYEKTGETEREDLILTPDHPAWWGLALESSIRIAFENKTGLRVYDAPKLLRHHARAWQYASLDGLVYKGHRQVGGFEAKIGGFHTMGDWPADDPDAIPAAYLVQVHHYMMVTGLEKFWVCALLGGQHFTIREVHRDPDLEKHLLAKEAEFWIGVGKRQPPQPDGSDSARKAINRVFERADDSDDIVLPEQQVPALERYLRAHKEIAAWEDEKAKAAQELQLALGEAPGAYWRDRRAIAWANVSTHRWDTKALARDHPELVDKYRKQTLTRPFKVLATQWKEAT